MYPLSPMVQAVYMYIPSKHEALSVEALRLRFRQNRQRNGVGKVGIGCPQLLQADGDVKGSLSG
jgi:hypothetical protein